MIPTSGVGFLSGQLLRSGSEGKTIFPAISFHGNRVRAAVVALVFLGSLGVGIAPLVARQLSAYRAAKNLPDTAAIVRARAAWFFRQRASANGHIPASLLIEAFQEKNSAVSLHQTFFDRLAAVSPKISAKPSTWTPLGPQPTANNPFYGNVSGRVTAIASDPCDTTGNTVYVGGADGGVWVSFNALTGNPVTWTPLTDSQVSLATGAIALVSTSCNTYNGHSQSAAIIVGTGESNYARDNLYGAGVLRSADGGHTWAQDHTFTRATSQGPGASGPYISAIAVQPVASHPVLLAAVQGTDYAGGGSLPSGIWRSTDGGSNWSRSQPGSSGATGAPFNPATDVVFDSSDSSGNTVYAALGDPEGDADQGALCANTPCNGVYVSSDAGVTWNRVTGLDAASTPSSYGNISLAISSATSPATSTLYVSIADSTTQSENLLGVLKGTGIQSNGSGAAFSAIYPATSNLPDFCAPLCFYDMKLAVLPALGGDLLFVGGAAQPQFSAEAFGNSSVYRSFDGGNTWADVSADGSGNSTSVHTNAHAFAFAFAPGAQPLALFLGNDGGVWTSTDVFNSSTTVGNQHWLDLNTSTGNADTSLNLTQFYPGVSVHPSTDQILFGGTQGNDAQQFSGSLAWSDTLACPRDGGYTAVDPNVPTTIYVACSYLHGTGTLNKNIQNGAPGDGGVNWTAMDSGNGIDFTDNADFIPPLVLDAANSQNLYFGTYRLYQSTSAGGTWSAISPDLTTDSSSQFVTAIIVAPSNSNVVYAGTSDGLLWQTAEATSGAGDVHKINQNGQPAREVASIAVDSANAKSAFAVYSGFSCPGVSGCDGLGHIFYTANSGASWLLVDGNIPDVPVNDIVIDPTDATDNTVYIATDSGVYASSNATAGTATVWSVLQSGLPNVQVLSLKLRNVSRTLVAGTHGRGAWNLRLPKLPGFVLTSIDPASAPAGSAAFEITATGNGFTNQSAISVGGSPVITTFVSATSLTASIPASAVACGGSIPVSVSDPAAGTTNSLVLGVLGSCNFAIGAPSPSTQTTTPGGSATYQFTVSQSGSTSPAVQFSCPDAPAGITCQFTPNPATPTSGGTAVMLTISVPVTASLGPQYPAVRQSPPFAFARAALSLLAAFAIFVFGASRTRRFTVVFACAFVLLTLALMSACGGGGSTPPPMNQTYQIPVSGSAGNLVHSTTVQLVVD